MSRCEDFIKATWATSGVCEVIGGCDICVHKSKKYGDCVLHDGDNRTSIVHGEVRR